MMERFTWLVTGAVLPLLLWGCASADSTTSILRNLTSSALVELGSESRKSRELSAQQASLGSRIFRLKKRLLEIQEQPKTAQLIEERLKLEEEIEELENLNLASNYRR
jgi:hypothetical protein